MGAAALAPLLLLLLTPAMGAAAWWCSRSCVQGRGVLLRRGRRRASVRARCTGARCMRQREGVQQQHGAAPGTPSRAGRGGRPQAVQGRRARGAAALAGACRRAGRSRREGRCARAGPRASLWGAGTGGGGGGRRRYSYSSWRGRGGLRGGAGRMCCVLRARTHAGAAARDASRTNAFEFPVPFTSHTPQHHHNTTTTTTAHTTPTQRRHHEWAAARGRPGPAAALAGRQQRARMQHAACRQPGTGMRACIQPCAWEVEASGWRARRSHRRRPAPSHPHRPCSTPPATSSTTGTPPPT